MLIDAQTAKTQTGQQFLDVWKLGGDRIPVKLPKKPWHYTQIDYGTPNALPETKILLSTLKPSLVFRMEYETVEDERYSRGGAASFDTAPYEQKLAARGYFKTKDIDIVAGSFDLEMKTRPGFLPNAKIDPIQDISYVGPSGSVCESTTQYPEYELIGRYADRIRCDNLDIIGSYYGSNADWKWILQRAQILGVDFKIGRDGSVPYIEERIYQAGKRKGVDNIVHIPGRISFDVFKEVIQDTDLIGIKNHKLKTVLGWYNQKVIKVPYSQIATLPDEVIREYCLNDSIGTHWLLNQYLQNLTSLADELGMTLIQCIERHPSHPSNLFYDSEFDKRGIVSDGFNKDRFPKFAKWTDDQTGETGGGYQAALVGLVQGGFYEWPRHSDFKSMYPNIFISYNYCPTTLLETAVGAVGSAFGQDWIRFKDDYIYARDEKIGIVRCKVDRSRTGITKEHLLEWSSRRDDLKRQMKQFPEGSAEYTALKSRQWGIKILMNTVTGYQGMPYARYGSYPLIVQATAHGRKYITMDMLVVESQGWQNIQHHTDGNWHTGGDCTNTVIDQIVRTIPEEYQTDNIKVEYEDNFVAGIFYNNTGYVVKTDTGKLLFHGVGLKGKRQAPYVDAALEDLVQTVFDKESVPSRLKQIGEDVKGRDIDDYLMVAKINKDEYSDKTFMAHLLANARKRGLELQWGDEIDYLATSEGFVPYSDIGSFEIDYEYYLKRCAATLTNILEVTHGFKEKQVLNMLKGKDPNDMTRKLRIKPGKPAQDSFRKNRWLR